MNVIQTQNNNRVQYIDALRGFAMLLVVFVHIEVFGLFDFSHTTFLGKLFSSIHMPTFFFISGLCMYKSEAIYDRSRVIKDIIRLLMPSFIVGILYTYIMIDKDIVYFLSNPMKAGYWFTMSLFEILMIYYLIYNRSSGKSKKFDVILIITAVFLFLLKLPLKIIPYAEITGNYLCLHQTCNYFLYFVIGLMVSKYKHKISRSQANKWISAVVLLLLIVMSYLMFVKCAILNLSGVWGQIFTTVGESIVGISGVVILYHLFNRYKSIFSSTNIIGRLLILIGNNTLAIYLVHYFLLPNIPCLGHFLKDYPSLISELIIVLPLTMSVVAASLVITGVIRLSPVMGKFLLGDK